VPKEIIWGHGGQAETSNRHEDCLSCRYLSICHGGCPMRTYSALGTMLAKYPYCEVYKAVFGRAESHGRKILHSRLGRKINLLTH
jgi:sulfatase maturation enzyme AslB (radical SAM superfamily)